MRHDLPPASEKDIQHAILEYLAARRIFHYRQNTGAVKLTGQGTLSNGETRTRFLRFGAVGSPDIVAVIKGRYVGIEVKARYGKQSPDQLDFEARLRQAGGLYIVARSVEDVERALQEHAGDEEKRAA